MQKHGFRPRIAFKLPLQAMLQRSSFPPLFSSLLVPNPLHFSYPHTPLPPLQSSHPPPFPSSPPSPSTPCWLQCLDFSDDITHVELPSDVHCCVPMVTPPGTRTEKSRLPSFSFSCLPVLSLTVFFVVHSPHIRTCSATQIMDTNWQQMNGKIGNFAMHLWFTPIQISSWMSYAQKTSRSMY